MKKLKIGILADNLYQSGFNGEILNLITKNENFEIKAVILNRKPDKRNRFLNLFKKFSIFRIFEKSLLMLIYKFEKYLYNLKNSSTKFSFKSLDLNKAKIDVIHFTPEIKKNNFFYYGKNDLEKIKNLDLDVIIRMCSGILKGEILNIAKFGIVSYHHGDNDIYRGMPPGFWEVFYKESSTGFIIQKLNEQLDNGEILFKGFVATKSFFYFNHLNVLKLSAKYIIDVLEKINGNYKFNKVQKKIFYNQIFKDPNIYVLIKYIFKIYFTNLFKILKSLFRLEKWKIAFTKGNVFEKRLENYNLIKNKRNSFIADPFLWKFDNQNYVFVEEYDYKDKKGKISCYLLNQNTSKYLGVVLEEEFHMSFPFIFSYEDNLYMCPETSKQNEIRIYKCKKFPYEWFHFKTIFKNIKAIDTLLFEKNSLWWLLTNSRNDGLDPSNELNVYYSKDGPLTDNWIPHKKNPIYTDINHSRNGGLIYYNNNIYRVNQKPSFGRYGKEFNLNLIDEINENSFKETKICDVKPNFFKNINGTHHLNNNDDYCVIDFI